MMRQAMDSLQTEIDAAYVKILDTKQRKRIKQIALQAEGANAFTAPNPEVVTSLALTQEQLAQIQAIGNEARTTQRQEMQALMATLPPPTDNANNNNGNNNGGPGGRGGRGGFGNMNNLDEATRTAFMQKMQDSRTKSTAATLAQIRTKVLTKGQWGTYVNMTGEAFDLTKLRVAGPNGPGGPGGPGNTATTTNPAATTPGTTAAPATTTTPAKTAPRAKSLREQRSGN